MANKPNVKSIFLFPRQREAYDALVSPDVNIVLYGGARGGGKGLPLRFPVLTPFGWKKMGDLKVGDAVCNPDGSIARIIKYIPLGKRDIYNFHFEDGAVVPVTEDHLWNAWRSNKSQKRNGEKHSGEASAQVWTTAQMVELFSSKRRWMIPVSGPVTFTTTARYDRCPVKPYTLGVLLGDGYMGDKALSFTSNDPEIVERVRKDVGVPIGEYDKQGTTCKTYRIANACGIARHLKKWGLLGKLAHEKFIPEAYLFASEEIRWNLLRGLMDTDGWADADGDVYFCSTSKQLIEDMKHLVGSLGGLAQATRTKHPFYRKDGEKIDGRTAYSFRIKMRDPAKCFYLKRKADLARAPQSMARIVVKIEKQPRREMAACISVSHPNSLFIVGGFVVTHNSHLARVYQYIRRKQHAGSRGLILRKTLPELIRNHIDNFHRDFRGEFTYNSQSHRLTFTNGSIIDLAYCDNINDLDRLQGAEYDDIVVDEAQQHVEEVIQKLRACLRTNRTDLVPKLLMTCNPGGIGSAHIKREFIDKAKNGILPPNIRFIQATVDDNPAINKEYIEHLESLPESLKQAWRYGNWDLFEGQFFSEFGPHMLEMPYSLQHSEMEGRLFGSLDGGTTHATSFGLWWIGPDNIIRRLFSYCQAGMTHRDHALEIYRLIESFPYTLGYFPDTIWADPALWTDVKLNESTVRSPIDEYIDIFRAQFRKTVFTKANNQKDNGCQIMRMLMKGTDGHPQLKYWGGYNASFEQGMTTVLTDKNRPEIYAKQDGDDVADEARYGAVGCFSFISQLSQLNRVRKEPTHKERLLRGDFAKAGATSSRDWYNL